MSIVLYIIPMNVEELVKAGYPGATPRIIEHVMWGRTAFPFVKLDARTIIKAASGFYRATMKGLVLCDFCHRLAVKGDSLCESCQSAWHSKSDDD